MAVPDGQPSVRAEVVTDASCMRPSIERHCSITSHPVAGSLAAGFFSSRALSQYSSTQTPDEKKRMHRGAHACEVADTAQVRRRQGKGLRQ
ncbi:hypothetical protein PSAB6_30055 [Paraburkholderia sabiae]|nr:hypothetical protein PSAB6_30055 [Paraburkholderia sabiae]